MQDYNTKLHQFLAFCEAIGKFTEKHFPLCAFDVDISEHIKGEYVPLPILFKLHGTDRQYNIPESLLDTFSTGNLMLFLTYYSQEEWDRWTDGEDDEGEMYTPNRFKSTSHALDHIEMEKDEVAALLEACSPFPKIHLLVRAEVFIYGVDLNTIQNSNLTIECYSLNIFDTHVIPTSKLFICNTDNTFVMWSGTACIFVDCTFEDGWSKYIPITNKKITFTFSTTSRAEDVDFSMLAEVAQKEIYVRILNRSLVQGTVTGIWKGLPNSMKQLHVEITGSTIKAKCINELIDRLKHIKISNIIIQIYGTLVEPINLISLMIATAPNFKPGILLVSSGNNIIPALRICATHKNNDTASIVDCQEELIEMGFSKYAK